MNDRQIMIESWKRLHPEGNRLQCAAHLNYSYNTVRKYWNNEHGEDDLSIQEKIAQYIKDHSSDFRFKTCARFLGISKTTVKKYAKPILSEYAKTKEEEKNKVFHIDETEPGQFLLF